MLCPCFAEVVVTYGLTHTVTVILNTVVLNQLECWMVLGSLSAPTWKLEVTGHICKGTKSRRGIDNQRLI